METIDNKGYGRSKRETRLSSNATRITYLLLLFIGFTFLVNKQASFGAWHSFLIRTTVPLNNKTNDCANGFGLMYKFAS